MHTDRLLAAAMALSVASSLHAQVHVYVDDDAPQGGNGLSWQTAFRDLHDAIELSRNLGQNRGEIRIAGGTYRPDRGTMDVASSFAIPLPSNAEPVFALVGGFAGLQMPVSPDTRNVDLYRTVLDADLAGDDLPGGLNRTDNAERLMVLDESKNTGTLLSAVTLDGIRFRGAVRHAFDIASFDLGVGLTRCVFEENQGQFGSSLHADRAVVLLSACTFTLNRSIGAGTPGGLGGTVFASFSRLHSRESVFDGNTSESSNGAAIAADLTQLVIEDTAFVGNYSGGSGGAIATDSCAFEIIQSEFESNSARLHGGAVSTSYSSAIVHDSNFDSNSTEEGDGGAIHADHVPGAVAVVINDCEFTNNNAASDGGGLYVTATRMAEVDSSRFQQNSANHSGGGVHATGSFEGCDFLSNTAGLNGGGADVGENTLIRSCEFLSNSAPRDGGGVNGDDGVIILYCDFLNNTGSWHGGGVARAEIVRYCYFSSNFSSQGGGLAFAGFIQASEFRGNIASRGGGVFSAEEISACILSQNVAPLGSACYFSTNGTVQIGDTLIYQDQEAGGSLVYKNSENPLDIVRSTLVRLGGSNQPMVFVSRGFTWIESSIIWDYVASQIPTYQYGSSASAVYLHSLTQFSEGEIQAGSNTGIGFFGVNLGFDPRFVDPQNGDFRLRPNSPAIDSGFQETSSGLPFRDIYGDLRAPRDDAGVPNTGLGVTRYLDIGAFEFQGTSCLADLNADGLLSPADFSAWIAAYNSVNPAADQNRDGLIDTADFSAWIANYNTGCP